MMSAARAVLKQGDSKGMKEGIKTAAQYLCEHHIHQSLETLPQSTLDAVAINAGKMATNSLHADLAKMIELTSIGATKQAMEAATEAAAEPTPGKRPSKKKTSDQLLVQRYNKRPSALKLLVSIADGRVGS